MGALLQIACGTHLAETLPFFVPALVLPVGIAIVTLRDRRRERDERGQPA